MRAAALTGSPFGFEASSLFSLNGGEPNLGQTLVSINPIVLFDNQYSNRMGILISAIADAEGVCIPCESCFTRRKASLDEGLNSPDSLHRRLMNLVKGETA